MVSLAGVVFDLDDTLILERDYVSSGFLAIAQAVTPDTAVTPAEVYGKLWNDFRAGVRGHAFDELLATYPEIAERWAVPRLVEIYREHSPQIRLIPGMGALVDALLARGLRFGVISDGPLSSQAAKAAAIGLSELADPLILTDAWGREFWKPHPRAFRQVEEAWGLSGRALCYVADNPAKDFGAPAELGWRTVRLRLPEQLRFDDADGPTPAEITVDSIDDLAAQLRAW